MTQPLPSWLSRATLTFPDGAVTTGLVELPLVFSGPSDVPLGWPYVRAGSGQESSLVSFLDGGPLLTIDGGDIVGPAYATAAPTRTAGSRTTASAGASGETPTPGSSPGGGSPAATQAPSTRARIATTAPEASSETAGGPPSEASGAGPAATSTAEGTAPATSPLASSSPVATQPGGATSAPGAPAPDSASLAAASSVDASLASVESVSASLASEASAGAPGGTAPSVSALGPTASDVGASVSLASQSAASASSASAALASGSLASALSASESIASAAIASSASVASASMESASIASVSSASAASASASSVAASLSSLGTTSGLSGSSAGGPGASSTGGPGGTGGIQPSGAALRDTLSGGQIAGITVGGLFGAALLAILAFLFCVRRRHGRYGPARSSSSQDSLDGGWQDLGPSGTGLGATGGRWARNGNFGMDPDPADPWMSESRQGSAMYQHSPATSAGRLAGWGGVAAAAAGMIGGEREMSQRRRWDPEVEAWREGLRTASTQDAGDAADDSSSSGMGGLFAAASSSARARRLSPSRYERPPYRDDDDDAGTGSLLPYRDEPDEDEIGIARGYTGLTPRISSNAPPVRPRQSSSGGIGSSPKAHYRQSSSNRSLGLGLPSARSESRFSRWSDPRTSGLDRPPSPPLAIGERKSSLASTAASPHGPQAAMFPLPPPGSDESQEMLASREHLPQGESSGSDDVVVFRGDAAAGLGPRPSSSGALRGRGGHGRRVLSTDQGNGVGGAPGDGSRSGADPANEPRWLDEDPPPSEELFSRLPGRGRRNGDSPPDPMYTGWAERQVPPEGETRPYVQSNYPGLRSDGSPRVSPATSRQQLAARPGPTSETEGSFVTSPTSALRQPNSSDRDPAWRHSHATLASSDQGWSAAGTSPTIAAPSSPPTTDSTAPTRQPSGIRRPSRTRSTTGSDGGPGRSLSGVLAGLGLANLFGVGRRSGDETPSRRSSGVPVLRDPTNRRTVGVGDDASLPAGGPADAQSHDAHIVSLDRISEAGEAARVSPTGGAPFADDDGAKSESDEEAGETSGLLRRPASQSGLAPRDSRGTFGQRIASEGDADARSPIASFRGSGQRSVSSSQPSRSESGEGRGSRRPASRGTFGQSITSRSSRGQQTSNGSHSQGSHSQGSRPSHGTGSGGDLSGSGFSHRRTGWGEGSGQMPGGLAE